MNRRIRRLGLAFAVLYVVLFVQLNRVQFFGAERLQEHSINSRGLVRDFGQERGSIVSADGVVIARSVEIGEPVDFRREYPQGDLYAHIAGYQSLNVAATGLERTYNDELAGVTVEQRFHTFADLFSDGDTTATLHLTIRDDVQRAARDALGDRRGSVVALDPRTGAVVALCEGRGERASGNAGRAMGVERLGTIVVSSVSTPFRHERPRFSKLQPKESFDIFMVFG